MRRTRSGIHHYFRRLFLDIFTKHFFIKIAALLITVLLWFIVTSTRRTEMVKKVSINFISAHEYVVTNDINNEVDVRLVGPTVFLREVAERHDVINIDVRDKKPGLYSYKLYNDTVKLPLGVKVIGFYPAEIAYKVEPIKIKTIKVLPSFSGQLQEGYRLKSASVEPSVVEVEGAESLLANLEEIYTSVVDMGNIKKTSVFSVSIDPKYLSKFQRMSYKKFSLYVDVVPFMISKKFYGIKVGTIGTRNFKLDKATVVVTVQASKAALERFAASDIKASLDLSFNAPGTYDEPVVVRLPEGVQLVDVTPKKLNVTIY